MQTLSCKLWKRRVYHKILLNLYQFILNKLKMTLHKLTCSHSIHPHTTFLKLMLHGLTMTQVIKIMMQLQLKELLKNNKLGLKLKMTRTKYKNLKSHQLFLSHTTLRHHQIIALTSQSRLMWLPKNRLSL